MPRKGHSEGQHRVCSAASRSGQEVEQHLPGDGRIAASLHSWKKRYAGAGVSELRELHQLREENRKLKTLVADVTLDSQKV